jgi:hypothetical protein
MAVSGPSGGIEVCPIKKITSYPCPACGSTKSVLALSRGSFRAAWFHNPFGFIILPIMTITPFWVLFDWFRKRKSLWLFYTGLETLLKKKALAIPLIILALLNWGWNIIKHNL